MVVVVVWAGDCVNAHTTYYDAMSLQHNRALECVQTLTIEMKCTH